MNTHYTLYNREEPIKKNLPKEFQVEYVLHKKEYSLRYQIPPHIWHQSLQGSDENWKGGWTSQVESEYDITYNKLREDLANRHARPIVVTCVSSLDNNDACKVRDPNIVFEGE